MAIITISRGTFSGGKMLAECLGRTLGYPCIDRDTLVKTAATRRVSEYDLRAALEQPPEFPGRFSHKRYIYLALIQAALAEQVRGGKAVYHGLAGHLLLKGAPGLLRLRIIAPLEFRAGMAQERLKLGHDEAIAHIGAMDRERRRWAQFLYGVDWGDPSLYDLTINLGHMSIERACRLVAAAAEQGEFSAREQAAMNDFVLASRVRAVLAQSVYTFHLEVEVECRQGRIAILGDALDEDREAILGAAAGVPGVAAVTLGEASPIRTPAGHP